MKNLRTFVLAVEEVLANKPFAYFCLVLAIAGLFPPVINWSERDLSQLVWPSITKMWLAIPFLIFHIVQMFVYTEKSNYAGIEPKPSIFSSRTIIFSYLTYISGIGILFAMFIGCKAYNFYINVENYKRKPINTWLIWDIIAVIAIGIIAYKIPNPITMEDILGY